MKVQDEQALIDATMKKVEEFFMEPAPAGDGEAWSFETFERKLMTEYGGNMPIQHGLFRCFLRTLSGMLKDSKGGTNYHDLGQSDAEVAEVINGMEPVEKRFFDTEIFVLRRSDGTVRVCGLLHGEGLFGLGEQQVCEEDLVDLAGGQALAFDGAMSDGSENGVQNRVIKAYVDGRFDEMGSFDDFKQAFVENAPNDLL